MKHFILYIFCFILFPVALKAQVLSDKESFSVDKNILCAGSKLVIQDNPLGNDTGGADVVISYYQDDYTILENAIFRESNGAPKAFKVGDLIGDGLHGENDFNPQKSFTLIRVRQAGPGGTLDIDSLQISITVDPPQFSIFQCPNSTDNEVVLFFDESQKANFNRIIVESPVADEFLLEDTPRRYDNFSAGATTFTIRGDFGEVGDTMDDACKRGRTSKIIEDNYDIPSPKEVSLSVTAQSETDGAIAITFSGDTERYPYFYDLPKEDPVLAVNNTILGEDLNTQSSLSFSLYAYDFCESESYGDIRTLHTIALNAASQKGFNEVKNTYAGTDKLSLEKNGEDFQEFEPNAIIEDRSVDCGLLYQYQALATNDNGTSRSVLSPEITGNSDQAATIRYVVATVSDDAQIEIMGEEPVAQATYYLEVGTNKEENTEHLFSFENLNPNEQAHCFTSSLLDECDNLSVPKNSCTIFVESEQLSAKRMAFKWTDYVGFSVDEYELYLLDQDFQLLQSINAGIFTRDEINLEEISEETTFAQIAAINNADNLTALSNIISIDFEPIIRFPNAFTPDGDGLNDVFTYVGTSPLEKFELVIFNRWGETIFALSETQNIAGGIRPGWNGTYKNEKAPAGTYSYRAKLTTTDGKTLDFSGMLQLIR
ncbi:gliding motility-associated C-terminal domain-containing protein [Persicobacter sp. CCB-QB2]|uniref:gliding motility-associated C-terminal domain-containing protein n=1 Tax=Persicobacter sp. CCB-QB2 TaxID=1561025 RepID=UPI0006A9AA64|nr:gliding motility-associated C-terminal domain-containing protein [Persicobacter sp. CCB-QB2]